MTLKKKLGIQDENNSDVELKQLSKVGALQLLLHKTTTETFRSQIRVLLASKYNIPLRASLKLMYGDVPDASKIEVPVTKEVYLEYLQAALKDDLITQKEYDELSNRGAFDVSDDCPMSLRTFLDELLPRIKHEELKTIAPALCKVIKKYTPAYFDNPEHFKEKEKKEEKRKAQKEEKLNKKEENVKLMSALQGVNLLNAGERKGFIKLNNSDSETVNKVLRQRIPLDYKKLYNEMPGLLLYVKAFMTPMHDHLKGQHVKALKATR